jgi:hypothetical protein
MLGVFLGFRARHCADKGLLDSAREDYAQARALFPESRYLIKKAQEVLNSHRN